MMELKKDKKNIPVLEYAFLATIVLVCIFFLFQSRTEDVNLARSIFRDLVGGRYGVAKYIDWENLKGLSVNVGATYAKYPTEKERVGYKKAFVHNFSQGFRWARGDFKSFVNWRIYSKDGAQTIVAADYQGRGKTLLVTLSGAGRKKLTSLQWK